MPPDDPRPPAPGPAFAEDVADALSDGLALCRGDRIVWANARLAELAGCAERGALVGQTFSGLFAGDGLPAPGSDRPAACRLRRGDESRSVTVRSLATAGGQFAWIVQDTTHVRALEEEVLRAGRELHEVHRALERARDRARRESEEREELLTVVAHELRTPTTVIGGYNKLLLSEEVGPLNEEQRRFLHESTKSCKRLNAFIGNLIEASHQVSRVATLEVCEASLAPTVQGVVSFLKPLLEEHELTIEVELDPRASLARFDPARVEQVLTNLVSNAIKYAPVGGRIEISTRPLERDGLPFVEVSVCDEGPGIAPEDQERIFLPYVRTGDAGGAGGLGLGLAICKRLVEAHGGTIGVEPRRRGGSRFAFTLPAPSRDRAATRKA